MLSRYIIIACSILIKDVYVVNQLVEQHLIKLKDTGLLKIRRLFLRRYFMNKKMGISILIIITILLLPFSQKVFYEIKLKQQENKMKEAFNKLLRFELQLDDKKYDYHPKYVVFL